MEFLMGLPLGHVTDPAIGLTRAQALRCLGNGVVPAQAALALRMLLGLGGADAHATLPMLKTPTSQLAVNGGSQHPDKRKSGGHGPTLADEVEHLLPTPNPFHAGNEEDPDEWRKRRADVFKRTGTRHGPALGVVAKSLLPGETPLTPDTYMPEDDD